MKSDTNPTSPETSRAHEPSEIRAGVLVWSGVLLLIAVAISHLVVSGVLHVSVAHEQSRDAGEVSPLQANRPPPPEPRLQPSRGHAMTEAQDLAAMRARDEAMLNEYGWVDRPAGVARIPIDRAIDLLAQPAGEKK